MTLRLRLSCLTTLPETEQYPDVEEQQDEERGEEVGHCGEDHHVEAVHRVLSEGNATPGGLYQPHPSVMKIVHLQRRLIKFSIIKEISLLTLVKYAQGQAVRKPIHQIVPSNVIVFLAEYFDRDDIALHIARYLSRVNPTMERMET